jgi:hypothetical protein
MELVVHQVRQPDFMCDVANHCVKDWLLLTTSEYMRDNVVLEKGFT